MTALVVVGLLVWAALVLGLVSRHVWRRAKALGRVSEQAMTSCANAWGQVKGAGPGYDRWTSSSPKRS